MKKITFLLFTFCYALFSFSQSNATYTITFESVWNASDHGTLPGGAHWSPLVGATHQTVDEFLAMGNTASTGVEDVAETGSFTAFQSEINLNSDADQFINGGDLGSATGTITINNLQVSEDYPLLTLATMIAPSPDWFIAVNSINLRSGNDAINNGWKTTFSMDLFPYDAGTEDGNMYSLTNPATIPQGVITNRSGITPFNTNKIGTFTFTYQSSTLGVENNTLKHLKVFPNPTRGIITISNVQSINLKTIEIYNVLGKSVKQISIIEQSSNKTEIDLTSLKKGIYLLNFIASDGTNNVQKLAIY